MERGKFLLDELFDHAYRWCLSNLEVAPVRSGCLEREAIALDSSTLARLRCQAGKAALLGKGYCHRARRAVRANIVAAAVSVSLDSWCARWMGAACAVWCKLRGGGEHAF
jgi:hypothetical protein